MIVSDISLSGSLSFFIPEIILALGAMALALYAAFGDAKDKGAVSLKGIVYAATICACAGLLYIFVPEGYTGTGFYGMFSSGDDARYIKILTIVSALLTLPLVYSYYKRHENLYVPELPSLMVLAVLGIVLICGARHFMALYVSIELLSLASYVLAAIHRDNKRSSEAGVKYFVLGALASCVMLFGISFIYGATGGYLHYANVPDIAGDMKGMFIAGVALLCAGLFFKVSAAPFHSWTPDVYQGAPRPVAVFFGISGKIGGVAALLNLCAFFLYPYDTEWAKLFIVFGLMSVFIGAVAAIRQTDLRRMIAFSSVGHMGYILLGLSAGSAAALQATLLYMTVYVVLSAGFFSCISLLKRDGSDGEPIDYLQGLSRTRPWVAFCMAIVMLSLAGIPPFAGFFAKLFLFKALIEENLVIPAVAGILASAISAYYYLRIIKVMYFDAPEYEKEWSTCRTTFAVLAATTVFNALFVFMADGFTRLVAQSVQALK